MAFHVACPITCRRICFCSLGFPRDIQSTDRKHEFLKQVDCVWDLFRDPSSVARVPTEGTVQVSVPKVVPALPAVPAAAQLGVGDSGVGGADEAAEEAAAASANAKRMALQRQAAATVEAAEDYARRFESGGDMVASKDLAGEGHGHSNSNVMCRMCYLGENEVSQRAKWMLSCKNCGKKYHRSCLKSWAQHRDLFHWSSWTCPSCRICEVCRRTGDPNKFMFCKRCDGAYHCYCQHPPHKNVSSGPYLCPKHTKCHSCGSTVPGNGLSVRWFLSYTCCDACGRLFVKGNYCPVCLKVYRDSESTPMVCCDICQRWVHCQCDGISDEKYLQYQVDGNLQYKCATCRGECYQVKDLQDAVRELWRRKDMADRELIASLRAAAGLPTEEEIFSISPFSDDEENGPVTGRSLKLSLKGLVEKSPKKSKSAKSLLSKKNMNRKGCQISSIGKSEPHQDSEGYHEIQSDRYSLGDDKNDDAQSQRNEGSDISSRVAGICSTHEPRIVKHKLVDDVMVTDEGRSSRIVKIKCGKPHDSDNEDTQGHPSNKANSVKAKKLVINLGARKINVADYSKSNALNWQKDQDQDQASSGGAKDAQQRMSQKLMLDRDDDVAAKSGDGDRVDQPAQVRSLKISGRFGKIKSEESVPPEQKHGSLGRLSEGNKQISFGSIVSRAESNHDRGQAPVADSSQKDPRPLLRFKLRKPNAEDHTAQGSHVEEEKGSCAKGQRSKRKRPSPLLEKTGTKEDEDASGSRQDSLMDEMMDASWILKKLGKDAIGKRVEVHQASDNSWHKGTVTDVMRSTSTVSVALDNGIVKSLELEKQGVRFIPRKQKRSRA